MMELYNMELCNVCARLIDKGRTQGLREKLDVFYAGDRLTKDEYEKLCAMLN
jgi:hypothetical protein